jgi:hypothetical protein
LSYFFPLKNVFKDDRKHQLTAPTVIDKVAPAATPPTAAPPTATPPAAATAEVATAALLAKFDTALTAMLCITCNLQKGE